MSRTRIALLVLILCCWSTMAKALLVDPVDPGFRHELQLVADAGLIPGALSTWPVSRLALHDALRDIDDATLDEAAPGVREAARRVMERLDVRPGGFGGVSAQAVAGEGRPPARLAWYGLQDPSGSEASAEVGWRNDRVSVRGRVRAVEHAVDDDDLRYDGSRAAVRAGNWILAAGAQPVWWGPGWSGSPIKGTASRPVPAVHAVRSSPKAFEHPWLDWIGPWTLHAFYGQLESDRHISNADYGGMRVVFRPYPWLEFGLSRTFIWAGEKNARNQRNFRDLWFGRSNDRDRDVSADQLAGWDLRLSFGEGQRNALYGHFIGEDEAGMLPANYFGMLGLERVSDGGNARWFAEFADTSTRFYESRRTFNQAYEHSQFRTGNRHRGRPLGFPTDNDTRSVSLGMMRFGNEGRQDHVVARLAQLNRNDANRSGDGGNRISERATDLVDIEYLHRREAGPGYWELGVGGAWLDEAGSGSQFEPRVMAGWQGEW